MDNNRNVFFCLIMLGFLSIFAWHILPVAPRGGQVSSCRDTTIYNITYRDTTIYDIERRDSVVYDITLAPLTDFDTVVVRDSVFLAVPLSWYHFEIDSTADVYATGYRVSVDSVRIHCREMTEIRYKELERKPKRLSVDVGAMVYRSAGAYVYDADVRLSLRIGDRWSVGGAIGMTANGYTLSPFAGIGVRYSLRTP